MDHRDKGKRVISYPENVEAQRENKRRYHSSNEEPLRDQQGRQPTSYDPPYHGRPPRSLLFSTCVDSNALLPQNRGLVMHVVLFEVISERNIVDTCPSLTERKGFPAECYNPLTNEWISCPSLSERKGCLASASLNDKIFALGSGNGKDCFKEVEMLDPALGRWIPIQSMQQKGTITLIDLPKPPYAKAAEAD